MKPLLAILTIIFLFTLCSTTPSCTKNNSSIIHDSTSKVIKDTSIIKDTTVMRDTIYSQSKNPIIGLWIGTYKTNGDPVDSNYYSMDIDSTGRMITTAIAAASGQADASTGPWQLSGTAFTATLTQLGSPTLIQSITAVYDSVGGTLTGSTTTISGGGNNTTFLLIRNKQ
jgi:hypothetical protein